MRTGVTLPELMVVTLIIGVLAGTVVPPARRFLDRAEVAGAAARFAATHEATRNAAVTRRRLVRYEVDAARARLLLAERSALGSWDTLKAVPLGAVRVTTSQRTVVFGPLGIGFGASNTTVILGRGAAAETLTVSRTGRLRHR